MVFINNRTFIALLVLIIFASSLLMVISPALLQEDAVIESMTAWMFFLAAIVSIYSVGAPGLVRDWPDRAIMIGIASLAIVLCLSELSFGARIVGMQMPAMQGGGEFDGVHDVIIWTLRKLGRASDATRMAAGVFAAIAIVGVCSYAWRRRVWLHQTLITFLSHPVRFALAVAIVLLAGAVSLDLIEGPRRFRIVEEAVELAASVALLASALQAVPLLVCITGWRGGLFRSSREHVELATPRIPNE